MQQGDKRMPETAVTKSVMAHETRGTKREELFVDVIEKISVTFSSSAAKEIGALQVAKSKLEKEVEELTRQLQLEKCMRDVQPQKIILSDGTDIPYGFLVWSTGVGPSPFVSSLDIPKAPGGRYELLTSQKVSKDISYNHWVLLPYGSYKSMSAPQVIEEKFKVQTSSIRRSWVCVLNCL
ncbi:Pyr redox 2 domain-containing protein [Abeliophyllum distichum]|uniref:Pyr redox 2 domain-containing protein n=1 Tax=Abeliophyllum distichum TaxID=126358 RepID=A0ABD1PRD1_9LAMI